MVRALLRGADLDDYFAGNLVCTGGRMSYVPHTVLVAGYDWPNKPKLTRKDITLARNAENVRSALASQAMTSKQLMAVTGITKTQMQRALSAVGAKCDYAANSVGVFWTTVPPDASRLSRRGQIEDYLLSHPWTKSTDLPESFGTRKARSESLLKLEQQGRVVSRLAKGCLRAKEYRVKK